jgi:hypothetical protein
MSTIGLIGGQIPMPREELNVRELAEARLGEPQAEFEAGQTRLQQAELEVARLPEALLRISGAIQVLQELLATQQEGDQHGELETPGEHAAG